MKNSIGEHVAAIGVGGDIRLDSCEAAFDERQAGHRRLSITGLPPVFAMVPFLMAVILASTSQLYALRDPPNDIRHPLTHDILVLDLLLRTRI